MGRDQSSATRRENTQPTHTKTGKHSIHHFFYHLQPEDKMLSQLTPKQEKTAFIISFDSPTTLHMDHPHQSRYECKTRQDCHLESFKYLAHAATEKTANLVHTEEHNVLTTSLHSVLKSPKALCL